MTDDPLEITGTWTIDSFCTLDFGDREVILSGTLNVDELEFFAGDLTIAAVAEWLYALNFQFVPLALPIPAPFPECGVAATTTESLGCDAPPCP